MTKTNRLGGSRLSRASHEDGAAAAIEVGLAQRERFVDAKTGAPEHDDQPAQPPAVQTVAGDAHDRDDLLDGGGSAG
jgi:hypothetical protein